MEQSLTIFYTANIRGDLQQLPLLYTYYQILLHEKIATYEHSIYKPLLLDLGNFCDDSVWHCQVTKGRSTLMVMDAMGYHAVNIDNTFQGTERTKTEQLVQIGLVDDTQEWVYDIAGIRDNRIFAVTSPLKAPTMGIQIVLTPKATTQLDGEVLHLQSVTPSQIGFVQVQLGQSPTVIDHQIFDLPINTPPNPTIIASVNFVEDEARFYQQNSS